MTENRSGEPEAAGAVSASPDVAASVFAAVDGGLAVVGPDGAIEWVDADLAGYFGFDAATAAGSPHAEFVQTRLRPALADPDRVAAALADGDARVPDLHVLPDGDRDERWLRHRSRPIQTGPLAGGRVELFTDVTADRSGERAVEAHQSETLLEHVPDGAVTLVDDAMRYQLARGQLFETLGLSPAAMEGTHVGELGDSEPFVQSYRDAFEGRPATVERTVDGRVLVHRTVPVDGDDGTVEAVIGLTADVTGRRARERDHRRTREFLGDIQSVAGIGGWELDLRSDRLRWTDELYSIHGLSEAFEPTVSAAMDLYHPEDQPTIQRAYDALTTEGEPFDLELRLVTGADEVRWVRALGEPWTDEDGDLVGARGTLQDITARTTRERELQRKSRALEEAPVGIAITDPTQEDNPMTYVNRQFEAVTGYDRSEVLGRNCRFLQGEGTDPDAVATLRAAIDAERSVSVELRNYRRDGTPFWNCLDIAPVRDEADELVSFVGFQQDVTDRVVRERELVESRTRYRALVENFPNGAVALVDRDLRYTAVGGTPIDEAAVGAADLQGQPVSEVLPDDLADLLVPHYRAALDGDQQAFTSTVGDRDYRFLVVPVADDDGEVFAAMGMSQDITDERARERELWETRQRLDIALTETDTGVWMIDETSSVTPFGKTADLFGVAPETNELGAYLEAIHPDDLATVETELERARERGERLDVEFRLLTDDRMRWVHCRGKRIDPDDGGPRRMFGVTTDITERKHRVRALERRERILRELHTATREFYPPRSLSDIAEYLVEFIENAFGFEYVGVKQFDEAEGRLRSTGGSGGFGDAGLGPIEPGDNPIWEPYRRGETMVFESDELDGVLAEFERPVSQLLVVPVGEFGVTLAATIDGRRFDQVHVDLIEMLAANAESAFQRLRSDGVRTEMLAELSAQQARVDELQGLVDAIQAIQQRVAGSDSRATLEAGVCADLLETDRIDFAWIGRPEGGDTDLSPAAWAGGADGYLDSTLSGSESATLPAVRAARDRRTIAVSPISGSVFDEPWAKEALSYSFNSVLSTPLVYDDVLYGVLTVYSADENAFDAFYNDFVADVASLLVNYTRILEQRQPASQHQYTTVEFELSDTVYPLQRLADATGCTVRFDTVAETMADEVRVLVTVLDGDADRVLDQAASMASVVAAEWFGGVEHRQLSLTLRRPFLATLVGKHGGRLVWAVSEPGTSTVRIELPGSVSKRPLLDSLTSRYEAIDLVAQRQTTSPSAGGPTDVGDLLTDRQQEILNAAYHGGYYETPRAVTGEELAESFGISSPAVYNHLQAAQRRLLATVFNSESDD